MHITLFYTSSKTAWMFQLNLTLGDLSKPEILRGGIYTLPLPLSMPYLPIKMFPVSRFDTIFKTSRQKSCYRVQQPFQLCWSSLNLMTRQMICSTHCVEWESCNEKKKRRWVIVNIVTSYPNSMTNPCLPGNHAYVSTHNFIPQYIHYLIHLPRPSECLSHDI
jgi:hypothetical protein